MYIKPVSQQGNIASINDINVSNAKGDNDESQQIFNMLNRTPLSITSLKTYMKVKNESREPIVKNIIKMKFMVKDESLEKFENLVCMISIGLSNQRADPKLMGVEVKLSLETIVEFLRQETDLPKETDYIKLGLRLCCACMHDKMLYKQGNSLTGTAEKIIQKSNKQYTKDNMQSIDDLKFKISSGNFTQSEILFEVEYLVNDETGMCSNHFRNSSNNKGAFVKLGEIIKSNTKYTNLLIAKFQKIEDSNKKELLVKFIYHLNYFTRKALNKTSTAEYVSGKKTQDRVASASISDHRVEVTLGGIKTFLKERINIDITTQEAFILAATCVVQNEGAEKLNDSAVDFIKSFMGKESCSKAEQEEMFGSISSAFSSANVILDERIIPYFNIYKFETDKSGNMKFTPKSRRIPSNVADSQQLRSSFNSKSHAEEVKNPEDVANHGSKDGETYFRQKDHLNSFDQLHNEFQPNNAQNKSFNVVEDGNQQSVSNLGEEVKVSEEIVKVYYAQEDDRASFSSEAAGDISDNESVTSVLSDDLCDDIGLEDESKKDHTPTSKVKSNSDQTQAAILAKIKEEQYPTPPPAMPFPPAPPAPQVQVSEKNKVQPADLLAGIQKGIKLRKVNLPPVEGQQTQKELDIKAFMDKGFDRKSAEKMLGIRESTTQIDALDDNWDDAD